MKKKTNLGISNAMLAATIFISGAISPIVMFGLIIYTLLFEKDEFAILSAKRATLIYVFISSFYAVIHIFDYVIRIFITDLGNYNAAFNKISYLLSLVELLLFLGMTIKAFMTQDANPGELDNKVENILNSMSNEVSVENASEHKQNTTFCSMCGHEMKTKSRFCEKCGNKME